MNTRTMLRILDVTIVVNVLFLACGCHGPAPSTGSREKGMVWIFPGVQSAPKDMYRAMNGYRDGGVEAALVVHDWSKPAGGFQNLINEKRNRFDAEQVAKRVATYRDDYPDAPIDFVGYSGGGAMAVWVAESLSDHVRLRNVVIVQPGLSAHYDLTPALSRVDGKLVHYYAPGDWFVLGLVTTLVGSMDRVAGGSAGWLGFVEEKAVPDPHLREKFVQRGWDLQMMKSGHLGGHADMNGRTFNEQWVAPWLVETEPEAQ
jgi:pimeloyl-ACP methyl ester carboxylesterase